jgi:SNF2 family DNA or RNA helicase
VRKRLIESFNKGEVKVVFLGNLESTAGVNLQAATDVLMYNTMSESKRAQIIGRANRIGRKHQLVVHTLVSQQTA